MRVAWLVATMACSFRPQADTPPAPDGLREGSADAAVDAPGGGDGSGSADAVKFVQGSAAQLTADAAQVTMQNTETPGDLNFVSVSYPSGTITATGITDTDNNTYKQIGATIQANGGTLVMYEAANIRIASSSSHNTIKVALSQSTLPTIMAAEYAGLGTNPNTVVDLTEESSGAVGPADSGHGTTNHAHDLLVGVLATTGAPGAGTGFTARVTEPFTLLEDREVMVTSSYDATAEATGAWTLALVALEAAP